MRGRLNTVFSFRAVRPPVGPAWRLTHMLLRERRTGQARVVGHFLLLLPALGPTGPVPPGQKALTVANCRREAEAKLLGEARHEALLGRAGRSALGRSTDDYHLKEEPQWELDRLPSTN